MKMNEEWRNELVTKGAAYDALANLDQYAELGECLDAIKGLPSTQPQLDEWCDTCKEYDQERHCCPRFNRVIRTTLDDVKRDAYKHGKSKGIKRGMAIAKRKHEEQST